MWHIDGKIVPTWVLSEMYLEYAKKKFGIVKWTLQEQEIVAILNIPAVCDIQK
jgi:hypothetical protein